METASYCLDDGLGTRRVVADPALGVVEVLDLSPALADRASAEASIRERAARMDATGVVAGVHRVERHGAALRVTAELPRGVRLSALLRRMAECPGRVPESATLSVALALARAVARIHRQEGGLAHGAITPSHIVLMPGGGVRLTDAAFGGLLEDLRYGRDDLWGAFGLITAPSAGPAGLGRRSDLAQMAAVVLALALGRPLAGDDYPARLPELVAAATARGGGGLGDHLRSWLGAEGIEATA